MTSPDCESASACSISPSHALKEVDRAALAVAREPEQVADVLRYALAGVAA